MKKTISGVAIAVVITLGMMLPATSAEAASHSLHSKVNGV
jgi:hypothetical protein